MNLIKKVFVNYGEWFEGQVLSRYYGIKEAFAMHERGELSIKSLLAAVMGVAILGAAVPVLWPVIADSDTAIQAMNGTDDGTGFIQEFWPIGIMIGGIGVGIGLVYMIMKKFNVVG